MFVLSLLCHEFYDICIVNVIAVISPLILSAPFIYFLLLKYVIIKVAALEAAVAHGGSEGVGAMGVAVGKKGSAGVKVKEFGAEW